MEPWKVGVEGELTLTLINSDDPTIRVDAGPGTGKTFGLVRRVQRILHPDGLRIPGQHVLIVAFNRVIAKDLADEIQQALEGFPHDGDPIIQTVHALCLRVIKSTLRLLLPHEREAMIYDVLQTHPNLGERYTRHSLADTALSQHEAKLTEHLELWQAAQRWLTRHNATLISDLPGLLVDKLIAGDYDGPTYDHVIVDEFQDLTPGEQELFMKLRSPQGSLVALGDAKQSIYRFRGNDPGGLRRLEVIDMDCTVTDIPIDECRRCPATMVSAANRLMSLHPPPMVPTNTDPANIHVVNWRTPQAEAKGLARHIVANMTAHPGERHLAMVTRRRFGYLLRDELKAVDADLSIDLSFSESLLESWPVREAFLFFSLLVAPDPATWRAWLGYKTPATESDFKAPKRNADAYLRFLEVNDDLITVDAIQDLAAEPRGTPRGTGGRSLWDRARRFVGLAASIRIEEHDDAQAVVAKAFAPDFWLEGASETATLDFGLLQQKSLAMVEELESDDPTDHDRLLFELAHRLRYMIATREPFESEERRDLQITTLWGAKGVTAHHVYLVGLCGEALPGERRPDYPGTEDDYREEQRRLFYVSITRSKSTLVYSRAKRVRRGEARQLGLAVAAHGGHWATLQMCPFLRDILAELPAGQDGDDWSGCGSN